MKTDEIVMGSIAVGVETVSGRGFTPQEVAKRCSNKLMSVSDTAPPAIRDQAHAFKGEIETVLAFYMQEAIKSDRTTIYNAIRDAGHPQLAEAIRNM